MKHPLMAFSFALVCLGTGVGCIAQEQAAAPLCATGFEEQDDLGLYKALSRHKRVEVVEGEGVAGSSALKTTYRGYERGSERVVTRFALPEALDEATLVFDVKFDAAFQFVKGGKLHGLGPDKPITGGRKMQPDGCSARAMWREDGLETYVYSQNKKGRYGARPDRMRELEIPKGKYFAVSLYTKLNDPVDQANGVMRVYINGQLVADHRDIQFRSVDGDNTKISRLLFSTFHGGQDKSWAPKDREGNYTDVYAYFDNFAVYDGLHVRKKPGE